MSNEIRISTGIEALDRTLDYLRPGDTVTWQMAGIGDFVFIATQFVTSVALTGRRIVYLRFGRHPEVVATEALARRGANIRQYNLDATVGFETFSVQVHRIISAESEDALSAEVLVFRRHGLQLLLPDGGLSPGAEGHRLHPPAL